MSAVFRARSARGPLSFAPRARAVTTLVVTAALVIGLAPAGAAAAADPAAAPVPAAAGTTAPGNAPAPEDSTPAADPVPDPDTEYAAPPVATLEREDLSDVAAVTPLTEAEAAGDVTPDMADPGNVPYPASGAPAARGGNASGSRFELVRPDQSIVASEAVAGFSAGNIISDAVFFNSATMGVSQIAGFIDGKVGTCRSGYTCLEDYVETTPTRAADAYCGQYTGGTRESAATIIYKVARACRVNPQVLLVMLQKEQGLITHTWPSDWRFTIAMGMGCPDTADCDKNYFGFFNQVYGASRQMQIYTKTNYFPAYAPGGTRRIGYHPNSSCGGSGVYVQNQATTNLYTYTPYQPNSAALAAGFGTGDACSSYGNRNFYLYFNAWFGSTGGGAPAPVSHDPVGAVESWTRTADGVAVRGWATDPDTTGAVSVRVKAGDQMVRTTASLAHPTKGSHGFAGTVPIPAGATEVCVAVNNVGEGVNRTIGCRALSAIGGSPFGTVDAAHAVPGGVDVAGWVLDPDTVDPISVRVKVDGVLVARLTANQARAEVGAAYPGYGDGHGFAGTVPADPGRRQVCVVANDVDQGENRLLACRTVQVLSGDPLGYLNSWTPIPGGVHVKGWALDPDTREVAQVRVKVDGERLRYIAADRYRHDLELRYPGYGGERAFDLGFALPAGTHEVCAVVNDVGPGTHRTLGCTTTTVYAPGSPFGYVNAIAAVTGGVRIKGWAIDPDTADPVTVRIVSDGKTVTTIAADDPRRDLGERFPAYGASHALEQVVPLPAGRHRVCVVADNVGAGSPRSIGCATVDVG